MTEYRYHALDGSGRLVSGEIEGSGREDAVERLRAQHLYVVSLVDMSPSTDAASTSDADATELTADDFYEVAGHLADLASANLPLVPALRALEQELPQGRLKRGMSTIADGVESGSDLAQVLESRGAPAELAAIVRAGARSGRLGEFLTHFIIHYRKARTLRRSAWLSLMYPMLLIVAVGAIFLFALVWVVPGFKTIFQDFGISLPSMTILFISLSDFLINYSWPVVIVAAVLTTMLWASSRVILGSAVWRRTWLSLPVIGTVLRSATLAWFTNLLALLVENKVPLPEALLLAGDGARDPVLRDSCRKLVASAVARGEPFALVAHEIPAFPATFVQMLTLEQQKNALAGALRALSEVYEKQARLRGGLAAVLLGPFLLCVFIAFVGLLVTALFMPLIKLLNELS
jgi:type II secretory pathway component PulF